MPETLLYLPEAEYERLRRRRDGHAFVWWLSGFAAGIIAAVVLGWVTPQ